MQRLMKSARRSRARGRRMRAHMRVMARACAAAAAHAASAGTALDRARATCARVFARLRARVFARLRARVFARARLAERGGRRGPLLLQELRLLRLKLAHLRLAVLRTRDGRGGRDSFLAFSRGKDGRGGRWGRRERRGQRRRLHCSGTQEGVKRASEARRLSRSLPQASVESRNKKRLSGERQSVVRRDVSTLDSKPARHQEVASTVCAGVPPLAPPRVPARMLAQQKRHTCTNCLCLSRATLAASAFRARRASRACTHANAASGRQVRSTRQDVLKTHTQQGPLSRGQSARAPLGA
eukprot:2095509-Pleurochrysis_carterae.AAC.1